MDSASQKTAFKIYLLPSCRSGTSHSQHAELLAVPDEPWKVEKEADHAADVSDTVLDDHDVDQGLVFVLDPVEDVRVDGEDEKGGDSRHHIHQDIIGGMFSVDV